MERIHTAKGYSCVTAVYNLQFYNLLAQDLTWQWCLNPLLSKEPFDLQYVMLLQNPASITCFPILSLTDTNKFCAFSYCHRLQIHKSIYSGLSLKRYVNMLNLLPLNPKFCCQNPLFNCIDTVVQSFTYYLNHNYNSNLEIYGLMSAPRCAVNGQQTLICNRLI